MISTSHEVVKIIPRTPLRSMKLPNWTFRAFVATQFADRSVMEKKGELRVHGGRIGKGINKILAVPMINKYAKYSWSGT